MELIRNESMRKQLYAFIKEKLNSGEIRRGEAINQKEILETLGISKTPFRDCMIQLEAEGIVSIIPCKGVVVRDRPFEELIELNEIAGSLESSALEAAFYSIRDNALEGMKSIVNEVSSMLDNSDTSMCYAKNIDFHMLMINECPNQALKAAVLKYRDLILDFPAKDLNINLKWERIFWREHKQMIDIIKDGDPKSLFNFSKYIHWGWEDKEEYFDELYLVKFGTMKKYMASRYERRF
ncbi:MAG: GntR family transcriptional regulator [Cloacibacillus porcorum]|nr:GntR family transcriptional regulator [Cloacibacillus porcorum]